MPLSLQNMESFVMVASKDIMRQLFRRQLGDLNGQVSIAESLHYESQELGRKCVTMQDVVVIDVLPDKQFLVYANLCKPGKKQMT